MTKTYRFDSRRDAQKAWPVGKGAWFDGHESANLWIVIKSEIFNDLSNSMWGNEVTFRAATPDEFRAARLRWLHTQRARAASCCEFGNPNPGQLQIDSRAEVKAIDAEIATLEAI
jgi:hypothetical protein